MRPLSLDIMCEIVCLYKLDMNMSLDICKLLSLYVEGDIKAGISSRCDGNGIKHTTVMISIKHNALDVYRILNPICIVELPSGVVDVKSFESVYVELDSYIQLINTTSEMGNKPYMGNDDNLRMDTLPPYIPTADSSLFGDNPSTLFDDIPPINIKAVHNSGNEHSFHKPRTQKAYDPSIVDFSDMSDHLRNISSTTPLISNTICFHMDNMMASHPDVNAGSVFTNNYIPTHPLGDKMIYGVVDVLYNKFSKDNKMSEIVGVIIQSYDGSKYGVSFGDEFKYMTLNNKLSTAGTANKAEFNRLVADGMNPTLGATTGTITIRKLNGGRYTGKVVRLDNMNYGIVPTPLWAPAS